MRGETLSRDFYLGNYAKHSRYLSRFQFETATILQQLFPGRILPEPIFFNKQGYNNWDEISWSAAFEEPGFMERRDAADRWRVGAFSNEGLT
jgi:hypothetical protein